jgi:predicted nucleic acid-binding protein
VSEPPVSDASPLIILAQGGRLDLFQVFGGSVLIPRTLEREILRSGAVDAAVEAVRSLDWLEIVDPGPAPDALLRYRLGAGEEAVLTWALAHPGAVAIIDERRARQVARTLGVPVIGTLGIITDARVRGLIPAVRPVIDHLLRATDWYLSPRVLQDVLARVGE